MRPVMETFVSLSLLLLVTQIYGLQSVEKCRLVLLGPGAESSYIVTNTELNVNFIAETVELTGDCCFTMYSHSTSAKGQSMMVTRDGPLVSALTRVGSVFMMSCTEHTGNIAMYALLAISGAVLSLVLVFALYSVFRRKCGRS